MLSNWQKVAAAMEAACSENGGVGIVHIRVIVHHNVPILWTEPEVTRVHPKEFAGNMPDGKDAETVFEALISDS